MIRLEQIREGSVVMVRPGFGVFDPVKVVVEEVEEDIKNGRPGICYGENWAYLDQVTKVLEY